MNRLTAALTLCASLSVLAAANPVGTPEVRELPVTFTVQNVNRSEVPCHSDGATYDLEARLVGPSSLLAGDAVDTAVLYVHGLGLSSYYWHFQDVPGYDHVTEMARLGHVGVVYDRLGYGDSPKPMGLESCYGSDADVAAQIVSQLREGDYRVEGGNAVAVDRVVVAAHSQAGLIVQPMAYSFPVADAIVVTSWTDAGNGPQVTAAAGPTAQTCLSGGESGDSEERPPFYAYYPSDADTFQDFYFHDADLAVVAAATRLREPDPCGQGGSLAQTLLVDELRLGEITAPVLLVYGTHDGYRSQPAAGEDHADRFSGSADVAVEFIEGTGNALTLERTAPRFRELLATWLCERDLADADACDDTPAPPAPTEQSAAAPGQPRAGELPATGSQLSTVGLLLLAGAAGASVRRRATGHSRRGGACV